MRPNTREPHILLAYCRDRLAQISQEIALLKDIIALLEAREEQTGEGTREGDGTDES